VFGVLPDPQGALFEDDLGVAFVKGLVRGAEGGESGVVVVEEVGEVVGGRDGGL
jgi:hypothetical protein